MAAFADHSSHRPMLAQVYSPVGNVSTVIIHELSHAQVPLVNEESRNILAKVKVRQDSRYEKEGKRWVRRRDNSRFVGNVHVVKPSTKDFSPSLSLPRSTFPKPLPPFLPRHLSAPSASLPLRDTACANAGRYSLSLKGIRKELRRSGPRAEQIVLDIEQELTDWLDTGGVMLFPESQQHAPSPSPMSGGAPLGSSKSIVEVHRSPTELIWRIDEDFPRFLLHCVARFHGVVSFSKTISGGERDDGARLTHLLRPNVTRPDFTAPGALDTPPASDVDVLSVIADTEDSDVTSEFALESEEGGIRSPSFLKPSFLPEESHASCTRSLEKLSVDDAESSIGEHEDDTLSVGVDSLTLEPETQNWEPMPRRRSTRASTLSSHSPRPVHRSTRRAAPVQPSAENRLRFWHYLFA